MTPDIVIKLNENEYKAFDSLVKNVEIEVKNLYDQKTYDFGTDFINERKVIGSLLFKGNEFSYELREYNFDIGHGYDVQVSIINSDNDIINDENDIIKVLRSVFESSCEANKKFAKARMKANSGQLIQNIGCFIFKLGIFFVIGLSIFGLITLIKLFL